MAHTGPAVTSRGVAVGDPTRPELVTVVEGREAQRVPIEGVTELHSLTRADDGEELLWIADHGAKSFAVDGKLDRRMSAAGGRVLAVDLDGRERRMLPRPPLDLYDETPYSPTSVAAGADSVWVADGYGAELLHRFDPDGAYVGTIDGTGGAGRFDNPHGLLVDERRGDAELLVADRRASRIQVFDLEGRFVRSFGEDVLAWPTHLATSGEHVFLTDLTAGRVTVFDRDDRFVDHLFDGEGPGTGPQPDGWPNALDDGQLVPPPARHGAFNTPHGICADADGTLYVTEWLLGGRYHVLVPEAEGGRDGDR